MDEHWAEGSIRGRIGTGRYTIEPTLERQPTSRKTCFAS